jgi:hypothetical protein
MVVILYDHHAPSQAVTGFFSTPPHLSFSIHNVGVAVRSSKLARNLMVHSLKDCPSRAKTFPMQEKEVFQALPFSVIGIVIMLLFLSCFDVSLCCTSHPSGSRLLSK